MSLSFKISEPSPEQLSLPLTSGAEDSHVKTSHLREWDLGRDLLDRELGSFLNLLDCLESTAPELYFSKTLQGYSAHTGERTSQSLPERWPSSGILSDGVYLTANTSECLNPGNASSLLGVI